MYGHFNSIVAESVISKDSSSGLFMDKIYLGRMQVDFVGGAYTWNPEITTSLYYSQVKKCGRQFEDEISGYYAAIKWAHALSEDKSLSAEFKMSKMSASHIFPRPLLLQHRGNIYSSSSVPRVNNLSFSAEGSYTYGAHTFALAPQMIGDDGDLSCGGVEGNLALANSSVESANLQGTKTIRASYNINMEEFGYPGLSFMASHLVGKGEISGKVSVTNLEGKYVIQSGIAKDLKLIIHATKTRIGGGMVALTDLNEVNMTAKYLLNIF